MTRVTLQTIADRVGVSRMTVSNAFSHPDQLSDDLRRRILAIAQDLGYVGPDPTARALARGTTGAIGVLLTDSLQYAFTDEVATRFLSAVVEGLEPSGLAVTLLTSSERDDVVPARDVAMDGALVYSCDPDSPDRDWLVRRGLPLVFVDQQPRSGVPSVNVDDQAGAAAAAQHVLDLGHRDVTIVTRSLQVGTVDDPLDTAAGHPQRQRMLGWLDVLGPAGVEPTVVHARANTDDAAREAAGLVLRAEPRPTAVLCFSDVLARSIVDMAGELGLAVPGDISVVGFDDAPHAARIPPALTTVRQDVAEKGRLAAAALMQVIDETRSASRGKDRHIVLPTELVVRESTAPPNWTT